MTTLELEELLSDNYVFAEYFYKMDQVAGSRQMQAQIMEKNANLARKKNVYS